MKLPPPTPSFPLRIEFLLAVDDHYLIYSLYPATQHNGRSSTHTRIHNAAHTHTHTHTQTHTHTHACLVSDYITMTKSYGGHPN